MKDMMTFQQLVTRLYQLARKEERYIHYNFRDGGIGINPWSAKVEATRADIMAAYKEAVGTEPQICAICDQPFVGRNHLDDHAADGDHIPTTTV